MDEEVKREEEERGGSRRGPGGGRGRGVKNITVHIRVTVADHVVNHGMSLR